MESGLCHHGHQDQGVTRKDEKIEEEKNKKHREEEGLWKRGEAHQVEDGRWVL